MAIRLPKSIRKYIRKEKARIRREVLDVKEQERQIQELYQKIFEKLKTKEKSNNTNKAIASDVLSIVYENK
jgi:hypothetical protein